MNNTNISIVQKGNMSVELDGTKDENEARAKAKEEEMNEFRKQLDIKREQRRQILARHRNEKEELEKALQNEKAEKLELYESNKLLCELLSRNNIEIPDNLLHLKGNSELSDALAKMNDEFDELKANNLKLRKDLSETNRALQEAYSDIADLNVQNTESIKQIRALKEVVSVSKTMISLREQQLNDLKDKLNEIERTLADRETNLLSADLRQEYERQLQNIRTLRGLYEERARLAEVSRQRLVRELDEHKVLYQTENKKCKDLNTKVEELETKIDSLIETIDNKNSQISSCQIETNVLKAEMAVVNKLFSQVLLGDKTKQDLDTLVQRLEENHGLLTQMAEKENGSEVSSALPKLLLELVSQVDDNEEKYNDETTQDGEQSSKETRETTEQESEPHKSSSTTAEEIVENLPKVWKVLIELLSHQNSPDENSPEKVTTCYKSVETKSGPVLVPSVSQTYIRLKDLILEKLGLIKEVNRMKQLNGHLETRLEEQERRLCLVTNELSKTWHVVGRLRRHHHQLHTHEKILKYELQQKRKLLNELKEELEYCREKWEQAREKNTQSERDWKTLRAEFSSRKAKSFSPSFNNSGESGYSDERPSDESSESNDESEYVAETHMRCKRKQKKSFETILDSSTDFNNAEREDPASDMLDVADLPLDTQENEENHDLISEPSRSEPFPKNGVICEETEDEAGDITHDDSCPEETNIEEDTCNIQPIIPDDSNDKRSKLRAAPSTTEESSSSRPLIDPAEILRSVRLQNERLAKKDKKMNNLEANSAALLKKVQTTAKISEQINNTLDHLINRPTTSVSTENYDESENVVTNNELKNDVGNENAITSDEVSKDPKHTEKSEDFTVMEEETNAITTSEETHQQNECADFIKTTDENKELSSNDIVKDGPSCDIQETSTTTDFKTILENVRLQNERLAKKDERLHNLESSCSEVVKTITNTLNTGDKMIERLDTLHSDQNPSSSRADTADEPKDDNSSSDKEDSVASTSNEIDHEARFAARDLRLKRLEEQTKSLVNKVNKTNSKGVKIHYKLEELHNIYGSESSRAGTPSEDNEDKSNGNESPEE
ncbi:major antigen isoform X2 [Helicoverpa zea]|nr:major antigen isoform X2 [Helicoverpa zea]